MEITGQSNVGSIVGGNIHVNANQQKYECAVEDFTYGNPSQSSRDTAWRWNVAQKGDMGFARRLGVTTSSQRAQGKGDMHIRRNSWFLQNPFAAGGNAPSGWNTP